MVTGEIYHVMNKSIEGYKIFNRPEDYQRMIWLLRYFSLWKPPMKFSFFLERSPDVQRDGFEATVNKLASEEGQLVQIIAYCLMPSHIHVVVKQLQKNGIVNFLRNSLNGYARYFNTKYKRKGTLWMSRFKNVLVDTDEQLLHLTRYIHLNPVTAGIVSSADDWLYSSYKEYVARKSVSHPFTQNDNLFDMTPRKYRAFVEDHADFQRQLAVIKHQILE